MLVSDFFPMWDNLTKEEQTILTANAVLKERKAGQLIHDSGEDCEGLILVTKGQLRAFVMSPDGKEVTLYRVLPGEICLFSASCILKNVKLDVTVQAEKETAYYLIPAHHYKNLTEHSLAISQYTNEILSRRFSDVMWLLEQIMWQSMDKRLAAFLLEEANLENSDELTITHEKIAAHLGTAREVITRILKYFQGEGLVELNRGIVQIKNKEALSKLMS